MVSRVLVALDFSDIATARSMAERVAPHVAGFKVGLELLLSVGPGAIGSISEIGLPVLADAKLHDIPNTVSKAISALGSHGARWVTVHGGGGLEMIETAVQSLRDASAGKAGVLVVTVLTSLDDETLNDLGTTRSLTDQVAAMASLARRAGAEGVICPPAEASSVKKREPDLLVVTPGIRPDRSRDDQRQVTTAHEALSGGADLIVVGRPITASSDPVAAAAALAAD